MGNKLFAKRKYDIQPSVDINNVMNLIFRMNLSQIEYIKNALIEREIFFQKRQYRKCD